MDAYAFGFQSTDVMRVERGWSTPLNRVSLLEYFAKSCCLDSLLKAPFKKRL